MRNKLSVIMQIEIVFSHAKDFLITEEMRRPEPVVQVKEVQQQNRLDLRAQGYPELPQ